MNPMNPLRFEYVCVNVLRLLACLQLSSCLGVCRFALCSAPEKTCLKESLSISIEEAFSPRPGLGAAARSRRRRWWPVWTRRLRGGSFLQLELSPSGDASVQKKKSLDTQTLTTLIGCFQSLPNAWGERDRM